VLLEFFGIDQSIGLASIAGSQPLAAATLTPSPSLIRMRARILYMRQATTRARARRGLSQPLPARQARSQKTRDLLLAAGWRLLARRPWAGITINDIVATARSSVGAFYARFADRDAFFESLAAQWIARAEARRARTFAQLDRGSDFAAIAILDSYRAVMASQHFWYAALVRGAAKPQFWQPFRDSGRRRTAMIIELRSRALGRALSPAEIRHIHFAFQMANGVINNNIVNRPGPILPGSPEFESELVRGLKAVAGFT
jgi:AcrR family transcriptional regulator